MVRQMTVRELIEELEEMPMDLPVISNVKEIEHVHFEEGLYYLDSSPVQYAYSSAVILE